MYKIKGPPKAEKVEPKEEEEKSPSKFSFHINTSVMSRVYFLTQLPSRNCLFKFLLLLRTIILHAEHLRCLVKQEFKMGGRFWIQIINSLVASLHIPYKDMWIITGGTLTFQTWEISIYTLGFFSNAKVFLCTTSLRFYFLLCE